jgi:2-phospho-L-lactate guanylyltransferase
MTTSHPARERGADPGRPAPWDVVVPVKPRSRAKSRLAPLGDDVRRELTTAFLLDTVAAAVACPEVATVLVVTDDLGLADLVLTTGAVAMPDGRPGELNASLWQGAAELDRRRPGTAIAALCGDLPCLRSEDLGQVLREARSSTEAFVADAAGVGTTLYAAHDLRSFRPAFGRQSRAAHLRSGAVEIGMLAASVRRDVDTPADLDAAQQLGVGAATGAVLATVPAAT